MTTQSTFDICCDSLLYQLNKGKLTEKALSTFSFCVCEQIASGIKLTSSSSYANLVAYIEALDQKQKTFDAGRIAQLLNSLSNYEVDNTERMFGKNRTTPNGLEKQRNICIKAISNGKIIATCTWQSKGDTDFAILKAAELAKSYRNTGYSVKDAITMFAACGGITEEENRGIGDHGIIAFEDDDIKQSLRKRMPDMKIDLDSCEISFSSYTIYGADFYRESHYLPENWDIAELPSISEHELQNCKFENIRSMSELLSASDVFALEGSPNMVLAKLTNHDKEERNRRCISFYLHKTGVTSQSIEKLLLALSNNLDLMEECACILQLNKDFAKMEESFAPIKISGWSAHKLFTVGIPIESAYQMLVKLRTNPSESALENTAF